MAESTFNAGISGRNVVAAPQASQGGTNNFYFASESLSKPRKPFSTVPFQPDPDYIERPSITAWLRDKCGRPASRAALVGLGGIGKSQLAVRYSQEIRHASPNTYIFWVHASTKARFEEAYRGIAERLQLPGRSEPHVDVIQLVYDWLCTEDNGEWLMVLDNADDVDVFYPKPNCDKSMHATSTAQRPLASFLPQSSNGMILITSRSRDVAERLTGSGWNVLSIPAMDEDQAHQLLRNKLQGSHDEDVAPDLLRALEYMPLAITQAAAYIIRQAPRMSPSIYLREFQRSEKKKAGLLDRNMGDLRRDPSASNSIVTTWQITFEKIRQERHSAADLLAFMSFFNPQGIPEWVVRSYQRGKRSENEANTNDDTQSSQEDSDDDNEDDSEDDEFEDDLNMLREFSLVAVTRQRGVLEMHALVQFCTRVWLSSVDDARKWRQKFLQIMSREYPPGDYRYWAKCRELNPHVELVIKRKSEDKTDLENLARLLTNIGWYKWSMGMYEEAKITLTEAVKIRENVLGAEHNDTLKSTDIYALVLRDQGKYEEAEEINRKVLDGREKTLGKEHPDTIINLGYLATVLRCQGKYKEAEQMNREALDGKEKALGREHSSTLASVNNLAIVLHDQGKYEEAEQMNRRALDGREKTLGKEHPSTLISVNNLALVLHDQGKYEEAERMSRRALDGREKELGKKHPLTLISVGNVALALQEQGMYEEAERMDRQVLEGREKALGKEHPETLASVICLASVLWDQGKYEEAEHMYRRVLADRERTLGKEHPDTLTSIRSLAYVCHEQMHFKEANELYDQALRGFMKVLGPGHPTTTACRDRLSSLREEMGLEQEDSVI
ncbi:hypothetical protein EsH8_VII_000191 [Colletotrichum jinshuiense]